MSTRRCSPMRMLTALLLVFAVLLMFVPPSVRAAETIGLSSSRWLLFQTLDGTVLDTTAAATATATVNVVLQQCTVQGSGLTVSGATTSNAAGSTAIALHILDTTVKDATLAFNDYLPAGSDVRIVNMTATMAGSTPLFDLQNFYLTAGTGSSMTMQRVRATWGTGSGGSVVKLGGAENFETLSGQRFYFSDAVVSGAAHMLEITPECTATDCFGTTDGLNAFDMITFNDARGAFLYSNVRGHTLLSINHGMVRFSNITMTGGQAFLEAQNPDDAIVNNSRHGNVVFSGISSDGALFNFNTSKSLCATSDTVKFTIRHINVPSVLAAGADSLNVPVGCNASAYSTWYWSMGNITVAGTLVDTLKDLENSNLYTGQVTDAYGKVTQERGGNWPTQGLNAASYANCVIGRDDHVAFVELVPGVHRAECNCNTTYSAPYCTTADDPLVYYEAYSPSPATCAVASCDTCLFGQTSECGACPSGYGLTADLGCDIHTCGTSQCTSCVISSDTACTGCHDGYTLSDDQSACFSCNIPGCARCTADNVCATTTEPPSTDSSDSSDRPPTIDAGHRPRTTHLVLVACMLLVAMWWM